MLIHVIFGRKRVSLQSTNQLNRVRAMTRLDTLHDAYEKRDP